MSADILFLLNKFIKMKVIAVSGTQLYIVIVFVSVTDYECDCV